MIYKHFFLFVVAIISSVVLIACSNDDNNNGGDNNGSMFDNEVVLSMLKVDEDNRYDLDLFGYIYIGKDNNFHIKHNNGGGMRISTVGLVGKLADISYFPRASWSKIIAVEKGFGYVFYDDFSDMLNRENSSKFYRFYVEDEIHDSDGKVVGYNVRYNEKPFCGKDTDVKLPKNELSFTNKGGYELLTFTDHEPVSFTCKSSASWCNVVKTSSYNDKFLTDGVEIKASPSDTIGVSKAIVTISTGYGKTTDIKVYRDAAEPVIRINLTKEQADTGLEFDARGKKEVDVYVSTTIPAGDIEIVNTASSWCEAMLKPYHLQLIAKENDTDKKRSGTITLKWKNGEISKSLNVEQAAQYITMENNYSIDNPYTFDGNSSNFNSIYFRTSLERDDVKVTNSADWLQVYTDDSSGSSYYDYYRGCLRISVNTNTSSFPREDVVTISNKKGTISYSFKVKQL